MKLCNTIHQIRIDFCVTPEVRRYVYVYLIEGRDCYLIDAGTAGSEIVIERYLHRLGRPLSDIRAVFLTHSHPDHIGGAAALKRLTGCTVYASAAERPWIEDIDRQFRERPIPNFHALAGASVTVDTVVKQGDIIAPEPGITFSVLETPGHSRGSVSYAYPEQNAVFCGDAIPMADDLPILVDWKQSRQSVHRILQENDLRLCCPAWDRAYAGAEIERAAQSALNLLDRLYRCVRQSGLTPDTLTPEALRSLAKQMGMDPSACNPLFRTSAAACLRE